MTHAFLEWKEALVPLCAVRRARIDVSAVAFAVAGEVFDMSQSLAILRSLVRQGYYCDPCLARAAGLSVEDVRRHARRADDEIVRRYRVCLGCLAEAEVFAVRGRRP